MHGRRSAAMIRRPLPGECPADARDARSWSTTAAPVSDLPWLPSIEGQDGEGGERRERERGQARVGGHRPHARPDKGRRRELLQHEGQQESGQHRNRGGAAAGHGRDHRGNGQRDSDAGGENEVRAQWLRRGQARTAQNNATSSRNPAWVQPPVLAPKTAASSRAATGAPSANPPRPTARAMPVSNASSSGTHTGHVHGWAGGGLEPGRRSPEQGQEQLQPEGAERVHPPAAGRPQQRGRNHLQL